MFVNSNIQFKLEALRQHKPPPIRRIRISDFGLPDPKRDPDRHQNCITWSLSHALSPSKKFLQNPFTSLRVIQWTDRQTDRNKNITSFIGGGNKDTQTHKHCMTIQPIPVVSPAIAWQQVDVPVLERLTRIHHACDQQHYACKNIYYSHGHNTTTPFQHLMLYVLGLHVGLQLQIVSM